MSLDKDSLIFDDISLSDIFKKIYINSTDKQGKIDIILEKIKNMLKGITDASLLLPLLKEILDVSVKNDEQLVKMAGIIQRLLQVDNKSGPEPDGYNLLPPEERDQILSTVKNDMNVEAVDQHLKLLDEKVKAAKEIIEVENNKLLKKVDKNEQ